MKKHIYQLSVKALAETGIISGYCSVFNHDDYHNDSIIPGAFSKSITQHLRKGHIKLLWQHQQDCPIGVINSLTEDGYGLYVEAKLLLDVSKAREAYALIESGAINGLSIGFDVEEFHYQQNTRIITKANLWEVSLVTFPANQLAKINNIKQQNKEKYMQYKNSSHDQIANTWENFKEINDRKEQEIARYGKSDPLTLECLNSISNSLDVYKSRLDKIEAAIERPSSSFSNNRSIDQHKSAFVDYLRIGSEKNLHEFEKKSLSSLSNQDGGYLITSQLSSQMTKALQEKSVIRQLASIETISSDSLDIIEDLNELGAGWVGEATPREDSSTPEISKKKILVHELYAQPKATQKLIDDANIDIEKWLLSKLVDVFSVKENDSFINGDGIGKPRGILSYEEGNSWGEIQNISSGDAKAITVEGLFELYSSLHENYAGNAAFIMSRNALAEIRMLKDSVSGRYIWNPGLAEGMASSLFGMEVHVSSHLPDVQPGKTPIIFADLASGYKIVDRVGVRVMRDPFTDKPFVKFYSTKRVGGDVVNFNAIKLMKISA